MLKHFLNSIIEIKIKAFAELGFTVGTLFSFIFDNSHLTLLDVSLLHPLHEWIHSYYGEKIIEGILTGAGSAVGAVTVAGIVKIISAIKKKFKARK